MPRPASSPSDRLMAPLTRHNTASSTGSGISIPAGHWILNVSGNCPRCHHHHRTIKIHVRASRTFNRIGDVNCTNCRTLWLASGNINSTRISLLSANTIPEDDLADETRFRSTLIQMVRPATTIATPVLSSIHEMAPAGPSCRNSSSFSAQARGVCFAEGRPAMSSSARSSILVPNNSRHTHTPRIFFPLGRRIDRTFPTLRNSRLGRLMNLSAYTNPPEREPLRSSTASASTTHNAALGDEFSTRASPASAAEALRSLELERETVSTMSIEQRITWGRTRLAAPRYQHTRRTPVVASAMVDNGTQLNWREARPVSIVPFSPFSPELIGVGNHFDSQDLAGRSTTSLTHTSPSIAGSTFSQSETMVEGESAPDFYLLDTLHRPSGIVTPTPLYSLGLQYMFQTRTAPISSSDSLAPASFQSGASTSVEWPSIRRSLPAAPRGSGLQHTEASAGFQPQSDTEVAYDEI
jgi:hypothetical protein